MNEYHLIKGNDVLYVIVDEKDDKRYEQQFPYTFLKVVVSDWNNSLSPWKADPVFGKEGFAGNAEKFSKELFREIEKAQETVHLSHTGICGYSLAGLYVLWLLTKTDLFQCAASVSGSLWFPGFTDYMEQHPVHAEKVYLSLGDKEPNTHNQQMKTVGLCTEKTEEILSKQCKSVFEWNSGGHYVDDFLRVSKGIRWLESESKNRGTQKTIANPLTE